MFNRQIPARDAQSLKQASQNLIAKLGGVRHAAELTQTTASRISEACSEHHENRWLSLVQVADLEAVAGEAIVTRCLAEIAGQYLAGHEPATPQDMHQHLAHIIVEASDVASLLATALQDGKLTVAEVRALRGKTKAAMDRVQSLDDDLRRIAGAVGPSMAPSLAPSLAAVK
jgi:hypothetical protein